MHLISFNPRWQGVYVLTDNNFRWFLRMSGDGTTAEMNRQAFAVR